jgi:hypothetical protein
MPDFPTPITASASTTQQVETRGGFQKCANWSPTVSIALLILWFLVYGKIGISNPPVGFYIGVLAFVAAIVSIMPPDNGKARAGWFLFFGTVLALEVTTLYQQRADDVRLAEDNRAHEDNEVAKTRRLENDRFADILKHQQESFTKALQENQTQFNRTIGKLNSLGTATEAINGLANETIEKLKEKEGALVAADTPSPESTCEIPSDAIAFYFGTGVAYTSSLPVNIFRVRGVNVVSLSKAADGTLQLSAELFDDRGDLVARIEKNKFLATYAASHIEKTASSLTIYGHHDTKVLSVEFLNQKAFRLSGDLRSSDGSPGISIRDTEITLGATRMHIGCISGSATGALMSYGN